MKTKYHSYKGLAAACAVAFALTGCSMLEMEKTPSLEPGSYAAKVYPRAAAGDAVAQCELAVCYANGGEGAGPRNQKEAVKWYLKSAKQGNAEAQSTLALYYSEGYGVEKNPKEAVRWRRAAAQSGNCEAQYYLATYYEEGYGGLPKDMAEAFLWYRRSALEGYDLAILALAKCYDYGKGCPPSREDAIYWYRKFAADRGVSGAVRDRLKELGAL